MAVTQVFKKDCSPLRRAQKYFAVLSVMNDFHFSEREVQLLAFIAVEKHIYYKEYKERFCKEYGSSLATVHNIICKLSKMGILVRENKKVKLHSKIHLDFTEELFLQLKLTNYVGA